MKLVALLSWTVRILLFLALLVFAVRNTELVTLRFYLDQQWQVPLVLALLVFFAIGAVLGVLACMGRVLRQRRELVALKREMRSRAAAERGSLPPRVAE